MAHHLTFLGPIPIPCGDNCDLQPLKEANAGMRPGMEPPLMSETKDSDRICDRARSTTKVDIVKQLLHQLSSACEELCEHNRALRRENSTLRDTKLGHETAAGVPAGVPAASPWTGADLNKSFGEDCASPQQPASTICSLADVAISINAGGNPVTDTFGTAAVDESAFDGTAAPPMVKMASARRIQSVIQEVISSNLSHGKHSMSPVWQQTAPRVSQPRLDTLEHSAGADEPQTKVVGQSGCCQHFISFPGSQWRLAWDAFGLLLIFYDMIMIPLRSFSPPENIVTHAIEWVSLLFWTSNVPLSPLVGYVKEGVTIMDPRKILLRYLTSWFVLDVVVLVPDWFLTIQRMTSDKSESSTGDAVKLLRIFRLTKCVRLLRIAKVKNIMRQFTDRIDSEYTGILINIIKMFLVLLLVNHFVASVWYAVGSIPGPKSWVRENDYDKVHWGEAYLVSFQWCLTQFTPASKVPVHPTNMVERAYAIFVVIFALVGFAYILGSISSSIAQLRALAEDADRQFYEVRRFLRQNEVTSPLGARILRFLEHAYTKSRAVADGSNIRIFSLLSDSLRNELRVEIIMPLLKIHPLFSSLSLEFRPTLMRLASCLRRRSIAQAEVLFFEAERATHMIFLDSGLIKYLTRTPGQEDPEDVSVLVERKEAWISEPVIWLSSWFHVGRATAAVDSDVLLISPREFSDMVTLSPAAFQSVRAYAHRFLLWLNTHTDSFVSDVYHCDHYYNTFEKFCKPHDSTSSLAPGPSTRRLSSTLALW